MAFGSKGKDALAEHSNELLTYVREQARAAALANRKVFAARLPATVEPGLSEVPIWGAAVQQIEQQGWRLEQWSVLQEANGPVAYPVFHRS